MSMIGKKKDKPLSKYLHEQLELMKVITLRIIQNQDDSEFKLKKFVRISIFIMLECR